MPPFRNLLGRKAQPNGGQPEVVDNNHLSPNQRPTPITFRKSCDGEPNEYKLSGTTVATAWLETCLLTALGLQL